MGSQISYVWSVLSQNTERQWGGHQLDNIFEDKASGKETKRPHLTVCLEYLREKDTLLIHSTDRFALNLEDPQRLVRKLTTKGVLVRFIKENPSFQAGNQKSHAVPDVPDAGSFHSVQAGLDPGTTVGGHCFGQKRRKAVWTAKALQPS